MAVSTRTRLLLSAEVGLRLSLLVVFVWTEMQEPFVRKIHPEEVWQYRNPQTGSYVPGTMLWLMVMIVPLISVSIGFVFTRGDKRDTLCHVLAYSLLLPLNGVITNTVKLMYGRPRPDFASRCWPPIGASPVFDGAGNAVCSGNKADLVEGRKSFPSGHSSFAFATFGFLFLYTAGKLKAFSVDRHGRIDSWRQVASVLILLIPTGIAISRTADYHHHSQDVLVGSFLGMGLAFMVYRFYYPPLISSHCDKPFLSLKKNMDDTGLSSVLIDLENPANAREARRLI